MIQLRPYQQITIDETRDAADKAERRRQAQARYLERHPERRRETQRKCDARPERKAKQAARAAAKRATPEHKAWNAEYRQRPDVKARQLAYPGKAEARARFDAKPESKAKRAARMREVRSTPKGMLENRMRVAIRRGLLSGKLSKSWRDAIGYTVEELRVHLERQFVKGMSWDNPRAWHIDHIRPLSSFNIIEVGDDQFRECWALSNLRPLFAKDNVKKQNKVTVLL